jgi:hypothetical protein
MDAPDEVANSLGFVEEVRGAFSGLIRGMKFVVVSPSQVEFHGPAFWVGIEREPFGHEVVGRVSSGELVATFDEIQGMAGRFPDALRPNNRLEMRDSLETLASDVVPAVQRASDNPDELTRLFQRAAQLRADTNDDDARAARAALLSHIQARPQFDDVDPAH